jgi:hypothetical protein
MVNAWPTGYEQKNETTVDAGRAPSDSAWNIEMLWTNPTQHTAHGAGSRHSGIRINRQLQVFVVAF